MRYARRSSVNDSGQRRLQKSLLYFPVVLGVDGEVQKVVFRKEAVEQVGRYHDRRWHRHLHIWEAPRKSLLVQQVPDKRQSASLSTQRSRTNPQEIRATTLEYSWPEISYQHITLFAPIFRDRMHQIPPQIFDGREIRNFARPKLLDRANSVRAVSHREK